LEKTVADKTTKTSQPKGDKKASVLTKRVDLPSQGTLGRSVSTPRWIRAIGGYFAGSWRELRQVSWPTRKATWGMTFAVLLFTLVLAVIILLLDIGFEQLFKRIIL
jgi:preprotein translocase SecE subunit